MGVGNILTVANEGFQPMTLNVLIASVLAICQYLEPHEIEERTKKLLVLLLFTPPPPQNPM